MDDLKQRLSRGLADVEPRWGSPDDVVREASRRHRRRRVQAGMLAGAVGTIAVVVTVLALRETSPGDDPQPVGPVDVSTLHQAWNVDVTGVLFDREHQVLPVDGGLVYALDDEGIVAFPKGCADPCTPAWRVDVAHDSALDVEIALGRDVVFITNRSTLFAIDPGCADDGSTCPPMWTTISSRGTGFHGPVASSRFVRVLRGLGGNENAKGTEGLVFDVDACGPDDGCQPVATTALGSGPIHVPGTVLNGVFYQQVGGTLTGIGPLPCSAAEGSCAEPIFSVKALGERQSEGGSLAGPVLAGHELLVSSGDGNLYAYDEKCGLDCRPLWNGQVADFLDSPPVVAGDSVIVASSDGLTAFPLGCDDSGGNCRAAWRARGPDEILAASDTVVIAADRRGPSPTISAYPADCDDPCEPIWNARPSAEIQGAVSDGAHLFVGSRGGEVTAYPFDCPERCRPVWRTATRGEEVWLLNVDASGVYVGSTQASPLPPSAGKLTAFRP